jgi:hypothetical protein
VGRKLRIDMTGQRFGRLVAIGFDHRGTSGHAHWLFRCDCGREIVACGGNVRAGSTSSCGCLHRELSAARLTEHGHRAAKRHEPTYRAWQQMRRAAAPVCRAWSDYAMFAADLGERPDGTKLGRRSASPPTTASGRRSRRVPPGRLRAGSSGGWVLVTKARARPAASRAPRRRPLPSSAPRPSDRRRAGLGRTRSTSLRPTFRRPPASR